MTTPALQEERSVAGPPVPRMELPEWKLDHGIVAGITTAENGFDMGLFGQGVAGEVTSRWLAFHRAMQPAFPALALGRQVHGAVIEVHSRHPGWSVRDNTDGHMTLESGVLLAVTVADCVPVYLLHPGSGAVALLHAGWKGAAAGIIEAGIEKLSRLADCDVPDILIHCGTSICSSCYEVGPEVFQAVEGRTVSGRGCLDLRAAIVDRGQRAGVRIATISPWCSAHHSDRFFSHRRSRGASGRMVAYLGRPLA